MGGSASRVLSGIATLGKSEFLQKKPFQGGSGLTKAGKLAAGTVSAGTLGVLDPERDRVSPVLSHSATESLQSGLKGTLGTTGAKFANIAGKIATVGVADPQKGRVFVPFSSGNVRNYASGYANAATLGTQDKEIEKGLNTPTAKQVGAIVGALAATVATAGVGSALTAPAGAAGAAAGAGSGAAAGAGAAGAGAGAAGGITAGQALLASTALSAGSAAYSSIANKPPKLPGAPEVDQAALAARNAVQTADAEARRARSAKRQSSVLGSYQAKSQINAATLTPAQPRRSVLG